jgi:hypothetical protein
LVIFFRSAGIGEVELVSAHNRRRRPSRKNQGEIPRL